MRPAGGSGPLTHGGRRCTARDRAGADEEAARATPARTSRRDQPRCDQVGLREAASTRPKRSKAARWRCTETVRDWAASGRPEAVFGDSCFCGPPREAPVLLSPRERVNRDNQPVVSGRGGKVKFFRGLRRRAARGCMEIVRSVRPGGARRPRRIARGRPPAIPRAAKRKRPPARSGGGRRRHGDVRVSAASGP